jgi:hypothetical protein
MLRQLPIAGTVGPGHEGDDAPRLHDGQVGHDIIIRMKILAIAIALAPCALSAQTLHPPAGATLVLRAHAQGDQIYTCQQNAYEFAWVLKAPDAQLFDSSGQVIGRHFAGPSWQLNDGSQVVGRPTGKMDSPEKGSVPWLSLTVVGQTGHGRLEHVTTIERVNTHGGQAPAGGCDASHVNGEARAKYTADYEFYSGG